MVIDNSGINIAAERPDLNYPHLYYMCRGVSWHYTGHYTAVCKCIRSHVHLKLDTILYAKYTSIKNPSHLTFYSMCFLFLLSVCFFSPFFLPSFRLLFIIPLSSFSYLGDKSQRLWDMRYISYIYDTRIWRIWKYITYL